MKKTILTLLTAATLTLIAIPLIADSVAEITKQHYQAMLDDLTDYISDNPKAKDIDDARMKAIEAAFLSGEKEVMLDLLYDQFQDQKSRDPIPTEKLLRSGSILVQFSMEQGNTEIPQEVLQTFKELAESGEGPIYAQAYAQLKAQMRKPVVGSSPELSGTTLDGKEISLDDYKGKVVMVNFWATWCPPCIAEVPYMKEAYAKYHEKGFEIIAVSLDRSKAPLNKFIAKHDITWPMIYDAEQKKSLADHLSVSATPTIFILDKAGKVISMNTRGEALEKLLEEQLGE
ncbi:TlpA disulfide reductase family protein [Kiritimatiellaeota bacterium B1221]|nr:TlpA disulfide reductase family protein [Kiritimatiellaeota bacterium B1221]